MQGRKTDPVRLFNLVWNHAPINQLVFENIIHDPRSLSVVDSLNGLFTIFKPAFKLVIELCASIETRISIGIKDFASIYITNTVEKNIYYQANCH